MASIDSTIDKVFQDWDDKKVKLHSTAADQQAEKFGPWAKLIAQRQALFVERWRPDRIKVLKKLGKTDNANHESIRGTLTPVAREDFIADLRNFGVPDRYVVPASGLVEVK